MPERTRKPKKFLTRAEEAKMKDDLRPYLDLPVKSHARGEIVATTAAMYDVTKGVVYRVFNSMHRSPKPRATPPAAPAAAAPAPTPAPVARTYELTIGDVTIAAGSKVALLGVLDKLLVEKGG